MTFETLTGMNLDIIFLVIDFALMLLLLIGLETGFVQKYWTEFKYKLVRKRTLLKNL